MFGLWNTRQPDVYRHQCVTISNFETSVSEFYASVENDLADKALTGLKISRVDYAEGGLLSAKRTYLRMQRERLVFDVCAAPFGSTWFFSYRASEIPFSLRVWEVLVLGALLAVIVLFYGFLFGWIFGSIFFALSVLGVAVLMRNTLALGLNDLDASLLRMPIIGGVYEALFRRETYYREDTRAVYLKIVEDCIVEKIHEVTAANGVKLLKFQNVLTTDPRLLRVFASLLKFRR